MLEFAQSTGVLPGVKLEEQAPGIAAGYPIIKATAVNGIGGMGLPKQQQQPQAPQQPQALEHPQHSQQPQQPELQQQTQPMSVDGDWQQHQHIQHHHSHHQQQQVPPHILQQAMPPVAVNSAADIAAADAERVLAQARGTVAVLAGMDQQASSRSTSYSHGAAGGEEGGGGIGIVRRAARRGNRGIDQSYVGDHGGYGQSGYGHSYGGGSYGGGSYGSGNGGSGGYGAAQQGVGPLGFAPSERTGGKQGKGLRHFSMKVCEKVESKGTTTYNEVADELVAEMKDSQLEDGVVYDEKNIRRRVYDAINVLMALDVIAKEKKAIMWRGFHAGATGLGGGVGGMLGSSGRPSVGPGVIARAQDARAAAAAAVDKKALFLADLLEQQRAVKALMARNAAAPAAPRGTQLELPFILVQAKPDATVEVQISDDMRDVQFSFANAPFQIHDDSYVLKMMTEENKRRTAADEAVAAAAAAAAVAVAARGPDPAGVAASLPAIMQQGAPGFPFAGAGFGS